MAQRYIKRKTVSITDFYGLGKGVWNNEYAQE